MRTAKTFGGRVHQTRTLLGLTRGRVVTQGDIGKLLGVTGVTVGRWELGRKEPTLAMIVRLAKVLNVQPCWLAFVARR